MKPTKNISTITQRFLDALSYHLYFKFYGIVDSVPAERVRVNLTDETSEWNKEVAQLNLALGVTTKASIQGRESRVRFLLSEADNEWNKRALVAEMPKEVDLT